MSDFDASPKLAPSLTCPAYALPCRGSFAELARLCAFLTTVHVHANGTPAHISLALYDFMRTDSMPIVRLQTGRLQQHDWHPLHRVLAATCIVFLLTDFGGLSPKDTCHGVTRPTMRSPTKAVCSCPQPPDAAPDSDIGMFWMLCNERF